MTKSVSVIIPTYNGLDLLKKNLDSVVGASKNPQNCILEIIVVDDGSNDNTVSFLKKDYPDIRVIRHSINRRFAASINTGVRMAKGNLVALLNNDVSVSKDFLVKPITHFAEKSVFAVSFHETGYGGSKGRFIDGFIVHEGQKEIQNSTNTFWANGGSCVMNRKIFLELGSMDEKLFSPFYWEDIDISYRALKRGYKIIWEPRSLVIHNHESTNKKFNKKYKDRIWERNQLVFIWKNLTSFNLLRKHLVGLIKRIIKHPGYVLIFFMALTKIFIVIKRRKKVYKESKISDEAIFSSFT